MAKINALVDPERKAIMQDVMTLQEDNTCSNLSLSLSTLELVSDRVMKHTSKPLKNKRVRGRKAKGLSDRRKSRSIVGKHYGRLTVLGEMGRNKWGHLRLACECECGNQTIVLGYKLKAKDEKQRTTSCGCVKAQNFVRFHDQRGGELPLEMSNRIFIDRCAGIPAWVIGMRMGIRKATVDGAVRRAGKAAMASKWNPYIKSESSRGKNYADIAAKTGLPMSTVGYIAKRVRDKRAA